MNNKEHSTTLEFKNADKLLKELEKLSHSGSRLRVGAVIEGRVNNIKNFGAFVELPNGQTGLIHISEISHRYVKDINEILSIGQKIRVKILCVEDNKIELSLKQAQSIPKSPRPKPELQPSSESPLKSKPKLLSDSIPAPDKHEQKKSTAQNEIN